MKKIALLLSILCISQLYGMEPEQGHYIGLGELSPEVQVMIIQALNTTYDKNLSPEENLTNTVNAIKAMSVTNKELHAIINDLYGDHKGFEKLVNILAKTFNMRNETEEIAEKFGTQVADKYILSEKLTTAVNRENINEVKNLIQQGVDINAMIDNLPLWYRSIVNGNVELTKLLLDNGMDINQKMPNRKNALEFTENSIQIYITKFPGQYNDLVDRLQQIKQLLLEKVAQ